MNDNWISVKEKLPKEQGKYLVTRNIFGNRSIDIAYFGSTSDLEYEEGIELPCFYKSDGEWGDYSVPVLAWCNLPYVYEGE